LAEGGWAFLGMPWLPGMVALFAFEFTPAPRRATWRRAPSRPRPLTRDGPDLQARDERRQVRYRIMNAMSPTTAAHSMAAAAT
jgi:hypothetical protein